MSFSDHFSGVSSAYAEFRPRYPDSLYRWLVELPGGRNLAWDCATGSGQAAVALASHFDRVIATDASAEQVATATSHPRIDYRVAPAEASGLQSESVDLVTVAQALHWLDRPAFFAEARRVLRSDGVLAAWTYGNPRLDDAQADFVLQRFTSRTVGPYWPPERALVLLEYRTVDFPFAEIEPPAFEMKAQWTLPALLGYIGTWSATTHFRAAKAYDPLPEFAAGLRRFWGDPEISHRITWPLSLRVGRRERPREVSQ